MLVQKSIEDVLRAFKNLGARPLFVRVHGPDLLPPQSEKGTGTREAAGKAEAASSGSQPGATPADPFAATTVTNSRPDAATSDPEMVNVLTQMMKCLFRDVTNEFRECFRGQIVQIVPELHRLELVELAAQLDLEMTDGLTASRLRTFWSKIDALERGVLFDWSSIAAFHYRQRLLYRDVGMREILVLAFLGQAFQVISGKIEEKQKQSEASKAERSSTLKTAFEIKNLLAPFAGLLTGGVVGGQVAVHQKDPATAVLLGLITAAVVSMTFSYSSSKSKSKETSLESVFVKDRSVPTLSAVLPLLVTRLREIGLAPVFVIDELDKVENLEKRMQKLVQHLKYIVTENSFSCFLTDRRYLTYLNRQANQVAYAREYTYFSDRLLVLYQPSELRRFLQDTFESAEPPQAVLTTPSAASAQQGKDKEDADKIAYVLLHRAKLHPIDVRRQVDRLAVKQPFAISDLPAPSYKFEILIEVAIEWLWDGEDVQNQIAGTPDSRQVLYDALYYVSRLWEDASREFQAIPGYRDFGQSANDKKPGFVLDRAIFSEYLESRCADESPPAPQTEVPIALPIFLDPARQFDNENKPPEQKRLGGMDLDFLFLKVRDLLNLLCNPQSLLDEIAKSPRRVKPPSHILSEILRDPSQRLLEQRDGTSNYQWSYDVSGRYLQTRNVNTIIVDVRGPIASIRERVSSIESVAKDLVTLQTMADCRVIPRNREWNLVQPALERLDRLVATGNPYGKMSDDRDSIVEFAGTLSEFEPNLKATLICAAIFAREITFTAPAIPTVSQTPEVFKFGHALASVSQILGLSASKEDDLRKLKSVIDSVPVAAPNSAVTAEDSWQDVVQFAAAAIKRTDPSEVTLVVNSAWNLLQARFTQRYLAGLAQFDLQFTEMVAVLRGVGPGRGILPDLAAVTAAQWASLLLRSFLPEEPISKIPEWFRVAASIELGMRELAEKLVKTVPSEYILLSKWVQDNKLRATTQTPSRRVLVLIAEQGSMTQDWAPSEQHGSLVMTVSDFGQLLDQVKRHNLSSPSDFPFDLVCLELSGDRTALANLVTQRPGFAIVSMTSGKSKPSSSIDPFLNISDLCYFAAESPATAISGTPITTPIVAPRNLDDLINRFRSSSRKAPEAAG